MTERVFETALGIGAPWFVNGVNFDAGARTLTINIDFVAGSRFACPGVEGEHPVHDTVIKRYRHLNFFQHECFLEVRTPRVKLPEGRVVLVEPTWAGKLAGFTLLFEAVVLMLCQQMTFAATARLVGESWRRVAAICEHYVERALAQADFSQVRARAIDETSRARGHDYLTLTADAARRAVIFTTEGREAETIERLAEELRAHGGQPEAIASVSIDMSPAYIKGVTEHLPDARITFDKFHVIAHASTAIDKTRRIEQKTDPALKGLRWTLLKDRSRLSHESRADLDALLAKITNAHGARLALPRTTARDPRAQADQRRARASHPVVHQRHALQGHAHEGGRATHPQPPRRHPPLGADPTDQWLLGSAQRPVPGRQAQGPRLPPALDHPHRHLPARRKTRLPQAQPARRSTHLNFNRAIFFMASSGRCRVPSFFAGAGHRAAPCGARADASR
jgi:transposase